MAIICDSLSTHLAYLFRFCCRQCTVQCSRRCSGGKLLLQRAAEGFRRYVWLMCSTLSISGQSCPLPDCRPPPGCMLFSPPQPPMCSLHRAVYTNETIPVIGLIFSIIHLFGCLTLGNVLIFVCLGPALFCAIVVSIHQPNAHISEWGRGRAEAGSHTTTAKLYYYIGEGLSQVDS